MRRFRLAVAVLLISSSARALKSESFGIATVAGLQSSSRVTSGQAFIRLSAGTSLAGVDGTLKALGALRLKDEGGGWWLVTWSDGAPVSTRLTALKAIPNIVDVSPSRFYTTHRFPSDPQVVNQWALEKTDAFRGWEFETGYSSRVTIAVIDSGIDGSHADLAGKVSQTQSVAYDPNSGAVASPNDPLIPACEHATEVAGVAAASTDNGIFVAGVSWGAQLVSYKVFLDADCDSSCGGAQCGTNDVALISALNQAILVEGTSTYGRIVVNMSLGESNTACGGPLQTAVTSAISAGIVVVAAAGNDGQSVNSPGDCAGIIPAGATDASDGIASFSSNGSPLATGGLVAPGVSVLTTYPGNSTSSPSGTSFASPMVAGASALLLSAKPTLTPAQVQTNLRSGADNLGAVATLQGAGRLNIYKSIYLTLNGTLPAANGVNAAATPYAFPNPFRVGQSHDVQFSIPPSVASQSPSIKIYTVDGRFVRALSLPIWDGRNGDGAFVASGSYVFVVGSGGGALTGRLAVIR